MFNNVNNKNKVSICVKMHSNKQIQITIWPLWMSIQFYVEFISNVFMYSMCINGIVST